MRITAIEQGAIVAALILTHLLHRFDSDSEPFWHEHFVAKTWQTVRNQGRIPTATSPGRPPRGTSRSAILRNFV